VNLIVLPEMFTTGFNESDSSGIDAGTTVEWMQTMAKAKKCSNNRKCSD
jgi:predicted amidohydrolase